MLSQVVKENQNQVRNAGKTSRGFIITRADLCRDKGIILTLFPLFGGVTGDNAITELLSQIS